MKILELAIWVIISLALVGTIAGSIFDRTTSKTYVDTFTQPVTAPQTFDLTVYEFDTLTSVTNGTTAIGSGNYTIIESLGNNQISVLTNAGNLSGTNIVVTYTGNDNGKVTGVSAVMIALITLIVIAGIIMYLKNQLIGKK